MRNINFIKKAISDYRVAALTASSKFVVNQILDRLREISPRYVVEYGPGDGVITREILKLLPEDGRLIAIETNDEFCNELEKIADKRFTLIRGNVLDVAKDYSKLGVDYADAVVSGIPFTYFNPTSRENVIADTHRGLNEAGVFIVYQFSPLVRPILKKNFSKVSTQFELRNFPPYFIMEARK